MDLQAVVTGGRALQVLGSPSILDRGWRTKEGPEGDRGRRERGGKVEERQPCWQGLRRLIQSWG